MKRSEIDKNKLSPMMLQYLNIKEKNEDKIIFFRLGDFYEMFFEDAVTVSHELGLTLTGKSCGLEERVPMCGIPYHSYRGYLEKLIEKDYKVAIVEQLSQATSGTVKMVERDIVQIVSKGTRLDDNLNSNDYNYIGNIYDFEYCKILSFTDISTGDFYLTLLEDEDALIKEIINHNIKELIVNSKIDRNLINILREAYNIPVTITDNVYEDDDYSYLYKNINDIRYITAIKHLLAYLLEIKKGTLSHLQEVEVYKNSQFLKFDVNTKRNLELTETLRNKERQYSLLWLMDKTKTAMGSRYLKYNIENPLVDKKKIERRYKYVEKLLTEFILKEELREKLDNVYDLERLASRISYGNLNAKDMIQLKNSLFHLPEIKTILENLSFDKTIGSLDEIYKLLDMSINEDAPNTLKEGSLIKSGYNSELDELHEIRKNSKNFILQIEASEREKTGIKNLKIGYNKVFGYYIEVSKGSVDQVKDEFGYIRKQTLTTGERFITSELKEKEDIILSAEERIVNLEYQLFMEIRDKVKEYIGVIQKNAKVISEIDMLQSFATLAEEKKLIKPKLVNDNTINIKEGRHPVVEEVSKFNYVPNDIIMGKNTSILLITGPNMAGKSTYMRQLAIIVIMAQIGSYVPATVCEIPVFDAIYTRIGASDDLVSGNSTFMVEMNEANNAISNATKNSLILFDELGRGTATYDGMSLAQAILEYIHDEIGCKTLFSTHYHELTTLASTLSDLKNVHVSAKEEDGKVTFLHKIKSGAIDKSYGINVASLAHLPKSLIERASEILDVYENKNKKTDKFMQTSLSLDFGEKDNKEDLILKELESIDPLNITPIDAINILYSLKEKQKEAKNKNL